MTRVAWIHTHAQVRFHLIPMHPLIAHLLCHLHGNILSNATAMRSRCRINVSNSPSFASTWAHPRFKIDRVSIWFLLHWHKVNPETENRRRILKSTYNGSPYRLGSALPAKQKVPRSHPVVYSAVKTGPRRPALNKWRARQQFLCRR